MTARKWLPAEPTEEMLSEAELHTAATLDDETVDLVYCAMYAAAPPLTDADIERASLEGARVLRDTFNAPNQSARAKQVFEAMLAALEHGDTHGSAAT